MPSSDVCTPPSTPKAHQDRWRKIVDDPALRDLPYKVETNELRARTAEWHDTYTLPSLWDFFQPSFENHGSYHYFWSTADEAAWDTHYDRWMQFVEAFKNRGGRVAAGSDSDYIFKTYGFGYIRELELLQEAGFNPHEVLRSATLEGAQALGMDEEIGTVEVGKQADLVLVGANPLENLKVLYGTGAVHFDRDARELGRAGGIRYTIKDGIVYDARQLLDDVREMVRDAKEIRGMAPDADLELVR